MLRRTLVSHVHLFTALVPTPAAQNGSYFTPGQLETARAALSERKNILSAADLGKCLDGLQSIPDARRRSDLIQAFSATVDAYRAELYKKTTTDASHRLQLHEAIMAAGFYQRDIVVNELQGEATRFVLNHYNFDVRRDTLVTKSTHASLHEDKETTPESDKLLRDLLLLERRLCGQYRLAPTGGRRWLVLGQALSEIKSSDELNRLLELPPIKAEGNFVVETIDTGKLWETVVLTAKAEAEVSFLEAAGLHTSLKDAETCFELRVQKPPVPLTYWEKVYDMLLRYWVLWFSVWVMFFLVDEEIITVLALIFLKYRQTSIMEEEAKRTGGKVYVATSTGRAF